MKEIVKLGLILFIISSIAAAALAYTYDATIDQIVEQRRIADEIARKEVFPDADEFTPASDDQLAAYTAVNSSIAEVFIAKSSSNTIGYVVKTKPSGFGGTIDVVIGLKTDGEITGLRVGNHQETPGLGANAKNADFYTQYEGLTVTSPVGVNKIQPGDNEILAISGATITSQAVTNGVNFVNEIYSTLSE